jgi:glycerophosphoryl diester phosphodiesterase
MTANRFLETARPRLFGHRGACGLRPENTLDSFAAALEDGASILELDVRASADGEVVVFHDDTLERTTDGAGAISAKPLSELRKLDAGYKFRDADGDFTYRGKGIRIPTLAEVLDSFPNAPLNVEIKQSEPRIEPTVVALLDEFAARDRVLLAAGDHTIMERIRQAAPHHLTSFSGAEVADFLMRCPTGDFDGYKPPAPALQVPRTYQDVEVVSATTITRAHEQGLEIHVWTVNEETEMEMLLELGVDGIMSDYPGRAAYVFSRRGLGRRTRGLD